MPRPKPKFRKRNERIQVYLSGVNENDRLVLDVWDAATESERVQEVFRSILRNGIRTMVENGDMPASIVKELDLASLFPPRGAAPQVPMMPFYPPYPMPHQGYPPGGMPPHAGYEPDFREPTPRREAIPAREPMPEPPEIRQPPRIVDASPEPVAAPEKPVNANSDSQAPDIGAMLGLMGKRSS